MTTKERRIPGKAAETNPLIAVVMGVSEEQVKDLEEEIVVTENYLAGLRAMRGMVGQAMGLPPAARDAEVVVQQALPAAKPSKPRGRPTKVREEIPPAPQVQATPVEDDEPDDTPLEVPAPPAAAPQTTGYADFTMPPIGHEDRPAAIEAARRRIVEFLFKRGLATTGEVASTCKVGFRIISEIMDSEWFEQEKGKFNKDKWRLTIAGKNQVEM